jgi:hyaluronate lyase
MNPHGWYTGDGALYVFLPAVEGHYSDAYWPTVDAKLIPGRTEKDSTPPALEQAPVTPLAFGGVRWDNQHGAQGLDLVSRDGTLTAKKSWFFAPSGVVSSGRISPTRPVRSCAPRSKTAIWGRTAVERC